MHIQNASPPISPALSALANEAMHSTNIGMNMYRRKLYHSKYTRGTFAGNNKLNITCPDHTSLTNTNANIMSELIEYMSKGNDSILATSTGTFIAVPAMVPALRGI